ncbi:MAG: hypothetical protein K8L99_34340 [Anaerolineae bacterium]|nr:hypothetical protein [Anaerolineae bacterium]
MDKTITSGIMIIISMIMALMLFNTTYPAIIRGGDAISSMTERTNDRLRSQISVIHAAAELDESGWWHDTNSNGDFDVFVWVKNVGEMRVTALDNLDVFFGPETNYVRIPHESVATGYPYWNWEVENGTEWLSAATLKISIHYSGALVSGRYFAKVTTSSGISSEYFLSM